MAKALDLSILLRVDVDSRFLKRQERLAGYAADPPHASRLFHQLKARLAAAGTGFDNTTIWVAGPWGSLEHAPWAIGLADQIASSGTKCFLWLPGLSGVVASGARGSILPPELAQRIEPLRSSRPLPGTPADAARLPLSSVPTDLPGVRLVVEPAPGAAAPSQEKPPAGACLLLADTLPESLDGPYPAASGIAAVLFAIAYRDHGVFEIEQCVAGLRSAGHTWIGTIAVGPEKAPEADEKPVGKPAGSSLSRATEAKTPNVGTPKPPPSEDRFSGLTRRALPEPAPEAKPKPPKPEASAPAPSPAKPISAEAPEAKPASPSTSVSPVEKKPGPDAPPSSLASAMEERLRPLSPEARAGKAAAEAPLPAAGMPAPTTPTPTPALAPVPKAPRPDEPPPSFVQAPAMRRADRRRADEERRAERKRQEEERQRVAAEKAAADQAAARKAAEERAEARRATEAEAAAKKAAEDRAAAERAAVQKEAEEKARREREEKARLEREETLRAEREEQARVKQEEDARLERERQTRQAREESARRAREEQIERERAEAAARDREAEAQRLAEEEARARATAASPPPPRQMPRSAFVHAAPSRKQRDAEGGSRAAASTSTATRGPETPAVGDASRGAEERQFVPLLASWDRRARRDAGWRRLLAAIGTLAMLAVAGYWLAGRILPKTEPESQEVDRNASAESTATSGTASSGEAARTVGSGGIDRGAFADSVAADSAGAGGPEDSTGAGLLPLDPPARTESARPDTFRVSFPVREENVPATDPDPDPEPASAAGRPDTGLGGILHRPPAAQAAVPTPPTSSGADTFVVHLSSFRLKREAEAEVQSLRAAGIDARYLLVEVKERGAWYRVVTGAFGTFGEAESTASRMKAEYRLPRAHVAPQAGRGEPVPVDVDSVPPRPGMDR